ncbi:MAG: phosphatidylglycerophosphatase A [bacterium]|nr:phosphatidylglycerophosphatase A [bacterium]
MDKLQKKLVKFFASFFVGYSPVAPGTLGTLIGIPLYFILSLKGPKIYIIFTTLFIILGIEISSLAETIFDEHDSPKIIIDEIAGFLITMLFIPLNIKFIFFGFTLFRIFDIWKPFPISYLQKFPGGTGIMADDILAGIYSNFILQIINHFLY